MLVCPLSASRERTLRQKKVIWELFQNECVQISASLICHYKETQNEFKYHSFKDLICKIAPQKMEKRNNGTYLPCNPPIVCYQQIKNSDAFSLKTKIQLPSKTCKGKTQIFGAEHRNEHDNCQPDTLPSFLTPFLVVFAPVRMLYSDCQDNNLPQLIENAFQK